MTRALPDHETWLEVGGVLAAAGLLVGLAVLLFGRLAGDVRRGRRHAEDPPAAGSVPSERHRNIVGASPR